MLKLLIQSWRLKLFAVMQKTCVHPPSAVKVDLLEGDAPGRLVTWCEMCGAVKLVTFNRPENFPACFDSFDWRIPRADWYLHLPANEYITRTENK